MPYIITEYHAGHTIEIYKTFSKRYGKKIPRSANQNMTPDDVRKNNQRLAERNLRMLINANFQKGDLFLTLTYEVAQTVENAKKLLSKFIRALRAEYRASDTELKYISVTEYLNKRIHHHMIVNTFDPRRIQTLWKYGLIRSETLYGYEFSSLAAYLIKETSKTYQLPNAPQRKRWNASKNLTPPKKTVRIVKAKEWNQNPKPRKGYYIPPESVRYGVNVLGIPYQSYYMVLTQRRE